MMSRASLIQSIAKPSRKALTILREGVGATTGLAFLVVASATVSAGALIAGRPQMAFYLLGAIAAMDYILLCFSEFFAAFAILILFALTVWLSGIRVMGGISAMIGLGAIFTAFWLTRLYFKAIVVPKVKEFRLLLALAVVVIVSALLHMNGPAGLSAVPTYLQLFLLFVLVISFTTTPDRLRVLGDMIITSSVLLAALILLDFFGWLPVELIPEQTLSLAVKGGVIAVSRTAGLWGDANFTAVQLTVALPFILARLPTVGQFRRPLLLAAGGLILAAFVWTFSMGGLLGVSVMLLTSMIMTAPRQNRSFVITRNVLIGLAAFLIFVAFVPELFVQRVGNVFRDTVTALGAADQTSLLKIGTGRGDTWWAALRAIAASPLLGYGPGNGSYANLTYTIIHEDFYRFGMGLDAHNMFLDVASDVGLVPR